MGYKYMPSSFFILCSVFTFDVFIVDILWNCGVDFYKEGESLPLAPKQVAAQIAPASSVDLLRFVACPLPFLLGLRPKTRMANCGRNLLLKNVFQYRKFPMNLID